MELSVIVPLNTSNEKIIDYLLQCSEVAATCTENSEIILAINFYNPEFANIIKPHLSDRIKVVVVQENSDFQKIAMAGYKVAKGDAVMYITPDYEPKLIIDFFEEWQNGEDVVCGRYKLSKFKNTLTNIGLGIYNFFIRMFGPIYSVGVLSDIELLDREVVDIMCNNQQYAHRIRTMYAPIEYEARIIDINKPIKENANQATGNFGFKLSIMLMILFGLVFVGMCILLPSINAGALGWVLLVIGFLVAEFICFVMCMNFIARTRIGGLHTIDDRGNIFSLNLNQIEPEKAKAADNKKAEKEKKAKTKTTKLLADAAKSKKKK